MGIETALLGSALIGGASSIFGANKAAAGAKAGAKVSAKQYADTKAELDPYLTAGKNSLGDYLTSLGLSGDTPEARKANQQSYFDNFQSDPGFQSFLDLTNKNAMRNYSLYGDTGGNLANQLRTNSEGAIYGQFQDRRNALAGLADSGRTAALGLGSIGQASANTQAQLTSNAGQFQGAGIIGAGNAGVNAFGNWAKSMGNQNGFNAGANPMPAGFGTSWTPYTVNRAMI